MRKFLAGVLALALVAPASAADAAVRLRAARQEAGTVRGVAVSADKAPLVNHTVQLRDVQTGQLAGSTTSNVLGQFTFTGVTPGTYVVEIVDTAGNMVGTTAPITVAAGTVATVTVTATAVGALAAAGAAGGFSLLGLGTVASVVVVGATVVGITAAVVATRQPASPSQ